MRGDTLSATSPPDRVDPSRRLASYRVATAVLSVVLIVLAGILTLNGGDLLRPRSSVQGNPTLVFLDGINRTITYRGPWTGYLGPSVNDSCAYCPVGAQAGGAIRIPLATWSLPQNASFWIYTNVSGPFLVQSPGCSPTPCTYPWVRVWAYQTFVEKGALTSMTLFATFLLPAQSPEAPSIVALNATLCPVPECPAPS